MAEQQHGWSGALQVLRQAAREWSGDRSPQIAAALAYYTLFSIAPMLVLATALAGFVYGRSGGSQVIAMVSQVAGTRIAGVLQTILVAASKPRSGLIATIAGTVTLVAGATGAFASVQSALDQIWEVQPRSGRGLLGVLRDRIPTFLLLLAVGVLLVLSLAASAVLTGLARGVPRLGVFGGVASQVANLVLFVAVGTILFSLVFKVLPDAKIALRDVWLGALVTAVLFAVGQLVIGQYLSLVNVGSAYGAAGSLIAVLVWLYYSGMTFLFGAELTQVMAARHGSRIEPSRRAEPRRQPCAPPQPGTGEPERGQKPQERPGSGGGGGGMRPVPQR